MDNMPLHLMILSSFEELLSKKMISAETEEEIKDLCELVCRCRFQSEEKREIVDALRAYVLILKSGEKIKNMEDIKTKDRFIGYFECALNVLKKNNEEEN